LLLKLQGAERGNGFEVVMEARCTHTQFLGNIIDAKRLVELVTKPLDRFGDALRVVTLERNVAEPLALLTLQEPEDDFPLSQGQDERRFSPLGKGFLTGKVDENTTFAENDIRSRKLERLEENIGAVDVELTGDDLREIDSALSAITVQGPRYPEDMARQTGR
jgi:hypothetical protein